jgi:hypothetical protein
MEKPASELYEEWTLSLPSMPSLSTLYPLNPIGIGTPLVESLTSYIARVALAHYVFPGVLMRHVIVPFAESHPVGKGRSTAMHIRDGKSTGAFNATHWTALKAVNALECLTKFRGLHALTMVTWAEVFSPFKLMRTTRAWCPRCLEAWRTTGQTIYEPLLWTVQAVKVCSQHDCLLETHCPTCSRTSPWLTWRSRPGYCTRCQQWLGMDVVAQAGNEREMTWVHWCAGEVGALLALAPTLTTIPCRARISEGLTAVLEQVSQGRKMTFARLVGLSPAMVGDWFYHQQLPSVENLLRVCFAVSVSLRELLMEEQITCSLRPEGTQGLWSRHHRRTTRGFWKSDQVRKALEAIARSEEGPPPSLTSVARQLGGDPHDLRVYHPVPSQTISARHAAYMQAKRQATVQQHCEEVQDAVRQLIEQDIPPTGRNVALILSKPGILRSSVMREARRAAIREREGQSMENRWKEFPKKAKSVI